MYIARLQLKNFKSFGDYHDLKLDSGFTAIVGPNGSGKSNILDALRWGLGDGSGSRLRITRQSDLLFQGTATIVGANSAEVALDLKEGEKSSVIRRKYAKEGGASLLVDGAKIRLQDLSEVKRRWRLDGDRFAFIGQGEITRAITQRPMERRNHLEELFGIDLYRKRRDQALSRMSSAEEELRRLQTLMAELRARRDEIAPEVETARKGQALEEELDLCRSSFYHHRRHFLEGQIIDMERKIRNTRSDLEEKQSWKLIWENGLSQMKERSAHGEREQIELKSTLDSLSSHLERARRTTFELDTSLKMEKGQLKKGEEQLLRVDKKLEDLNLSEGELQKKGRDLREELSKKTAEKEDLERHLMEKADEMGRLRKRRSELISRKGHLRESIEGLKARREAMISGEIKSKELIQSMEEELAVLNKKVKEKYVKERELRKEHDSAKREYKEANEICRATAIELQPLRKAIYRLESDQEQLKNKSSQGFYPAAVNHIMSASELGRIAIRPLPVIEAFDCPTELSIAMESYLGGRQFWLLVESIADAREGIEELKRHKAGRATYLPLASARPRKPKTIKTAVEGIIGWAIDLVDVNHVWRLSLEHLFGDLLIVRDYDCASSLVKSGHKFPIVTLDGEVFSPGGTISGGQTKRSGGALQARSRLRAVEEELLEKKSTHRLLESKLQRAEDREASLGEKLDSRERNLAKAEEDLRSLSKEKEGKERELQIVLSEIDSSVEKARELEAQIASETDSIKEISVELDSLIVDEEEGNNSRFIELKSEILIASERLESLEKETEKNRYNLSENALEKKKISSELMELKRAIEGKELRLRDFTEEVNDLSSRREEVLSSLNSATEGNAKFFKALDRCISRFRTAEDKKTDAEKKLTWLSTKKEELLLKKEETISAWEEDYPYPEGSFRSTLSMEEADRKVKNIERSIKRLGPYNRGSLSEDSSLQERLSFYDEQSRDVLSGIEELKSLIEETDSHAGNLFKEALSKIDVRFNGLFQRLFGGGEAHLRLQEGIGLWEAGVEIVARPPGKVFAYLAQLSGGEQTLTAMSLLFASMEVARVPLVVLDEVDAALDEVNLRRFADLVVDYSSRVQIIAMTHRRQTMERARIMYGVTMSEPGLSQVIGVKLEDWS